MDVIFAPSSTEIYPSGYSTYVEETLVSQPLCGPFRPGHFRGVTTIVLKLFNLVRPDLALFGLKDAQQYFVLKQMAQDLNLEVEIQGVPTVRELDGLALSSRNAYLSSEERQSAPEIYKSLVRLSQELGAGILFQDAALARVQREKDHLETLGFRVQYLELQHLPTQPSPTSLIAVAAYLGRTRLIDNIILSV